MDRPRFDMEEIFSCMRCGFCLPTCPTYVHTGNEAASPRGRIALMKGAAEGIIPLADIGEQIDACLGCLNCVTACPADVQFGRLLEDAREALASSMATAPSPEETRAPPGGPLRRRTGGAPTPARKSPMGGFMEGLAFRWVLVNRGMLALLRGLLWIYQRWGIRWFVRRLGLLRAAPGHIRDMEKALPDVAPPWRGRHRRVTPARGETRLNIGYFTGCVMDVLFRDTNAAAIDLLARSGCQVHVVPGQKCCGALHAHSGRKEAARALARRNIAAFEAEDFDYIVNCAGGCGAAMKEYHHWLKDDPEWGPGAARFASRVRDLSEVLAEVGLPPPALLNSAANGAAPGSGGPPDGSARRVTYQHSCHLIHGQKVKDEPRRLMEQLPGIVFREMAEADRCCGSAGIYNLTHPDMSMKVLDAKMEHVAAVGPDVLVTANPGCLLQMKVGVQRAGLDDRVHVVHLADLLGETFL